MKFKDVVISEASTEAKVAALALLLDKELIKLADTVLNVKKLEGPKGEQGLQGPKGEQGDRGFDGANGKDGADGKDGKDGEDGKQGVGVADAKIDFDGSLVITLTDGTEINAGDVVPLDTAEKIRVIGNGGGTSQSVLDAIDAINAIISTYGTMATQNANNVAITGGSINGTTIGATTPSTGVFTTLTAQTEVLKGAGNNIILYSQAINGTNWSTLGSATLTGNSTTAPDSTLTASTLTASGTQSAARRGLNAPYTATSGEAYTASIYFKAGTANFGWISLTFIGVSSYAWFNLNAGTVGTTNAGVTASITSAGGGWYRCSASGVSTNAFPYVDFGISNADNSLTVTAGVTIYLWGAQLEIGSSLGSYIPTTSSIVYGTPSLSFSGVASIGLQSDGSLYETSAGTGNVRFYTNNIAQEQMRVSHTASAVNYVQVTGAATTNFTNISNQGSDLNIGMQLSSKGIGAIRFNTAGSVQQFRINDTPSAVNWGTVTGNIAGSAPKFGVDGSDTNIDLALTPKGTGNVRFGTYTANMALTVQGYIEIKDSGGTVRKLAVIA